MTDTSELISSDPNSPEQVIATPRLNEFFQVLRGSSVSTEQVEQINTGQLSLLVGFVAALNYTPGDECPQQVTLVTDDGEFVTFTRNTSGTSANSRVICIKNLYAFQNQFQDASRYKQPVAIIYNLGEKVITFLSVSAPIDIFEETQALLEPLAETSEFLSSSFNDPKFEKFEQRSLTLRRGIGWPPRHPGRPGRP